MLTFVIPVRHPEIARNWSRTMFTLDQTLKAIARQDHAEWRAAVVVNEGAELPAIPAQVDVVRVDFARNQLPDIADDTEAFYEAVRLDKGRRILAGMLHARDSDYYMVVDEDDFVSRRLARFVAAHEGAPGWSLQKAYVWAEGGKLLYRHPAFHKFCGTSHIVRADLMELPARFEEASASYIKRRVGSHIFIDEDLREKGFPLAPLPFCGAAYRIGHAGATSQSGRILQSFIFRKDFIKRPWGLANALLRLRPLTPKLRHEFFEG